jgi:cell wall-associated NlpC family hydrolase
MIAAIDVTRGEVLAIVPHISDDWPAAYVGLPWRDGGRDRDGLDCWGLCILVYRELLGIELPDLGYAYESARNRAEVADLIAAESGPLVPAPEPESFDFLFLTRHGGRPAHHVGLAAPQGRVLHCADGIGVVCPRRRSGAFPFVAEGVYRHPVMTVAA